MARWRDVKKGKIKKENKEPSKTTSTTYNYAHPVERIKAFITDMFMIMMPIMYITTYVILDGKDAFQANNNAHFLSTAVFGLIIIIFWTKTGQTPGFKAYDIKLINDNTGKEPSFLLATARYILFIVSAATLLGMIFPFFREDKKTLQDILLQTSVIKVPREKQS